MANTATTIESWQKYDITFDRSTACPDVVITWTHRDRSQQQNYIVEHSDDSIGPEDDVTYTIEIYDDGDTLLRQVTGISDTTYTYTNAMELEDRGSAGYSSSLRVVLYSVRTGYTGESDGPPV